MLANQLVVAYEPEAAALYCKESKLSKREEKGGDVHLTQFSPGFRFMIIDMGGNKKRAFTYYKRLTLFNIMY